MGKGWQINLHIFSFRVGCIESQIRTANRRRSGLMKHLFIYIRWMKCVTYLGNTWHAGCNMGRRLVELGCRLRFYKRVWQRTVFNNIQQESLLGKSLVMCPAVSRLQRVCWVIQVDVCEVCIESYVNDLCGEVRSLASHM